MTSTVAEVAAPPLEVTAQQLAARHRVARHGPVVIVKLADSAIAQIEFFWDKAHPDHVSSVVMRPRPSAGERMRRSRRRRSPRSTCRASSRR